MESKWCWMLVALCALLMSNDAALADEVAVKGVDSDVAVVMQEQAAAMQQVSTKHGDKLRPQLAAVEVPVKVETEDKQMPLVLVEDAEPKAEGAVAKEEPVQHAAEADKERELEAAMNAEIAKQPSLQRLARHLRSFHDYQVFRTRKTAHPNALLQRAANNIDEDDEDEEAVAEERAVRRRQRVRRRNSKNKVRRTHRNKLFANRKKSTRRKQSKRNSVRRKNVRRAQSNRRHNTKRSEMRPAGNSRRRPNKRRSGGNSNKRRSGNKRRKSVRNSKRKSSQKRKKKSSRRRKHDNELADENTARQQAQAGAHPVPIADDNVAQDAAAAAPIVELPSH